MPQYAQLQYEVFLIRIVLSEGVAQSLFSWFHWSCDKLMKVPFVIFLVRGSGNQL